MLPVKLNVYITTMIRCLSYRKIMSDDVVDRKRYRRFSSYNNVQLFSIRIKKKARAALVITITGIISFHI